MPRRVRATRGATPRRGGFWPRHHGRWGGGPPQAISPTQAISGEGQAAWMLGVNVLWRCAWPTRLGSVWVGGEGNRRHTASGATPVAPCGPPAVCESRGRRHRLRPRTQPSPALRRLGVSRRAALQCGTPRGVTIVVVCVVTGELARTLAVRLRLRTRAAAWNATMDVFARAICNPGLRARSWSLL